MENVKKLNREKDLALDYEKNKTKQLQLILAKALKENGISVEAIHIETVLPINEINNIWNNHELIERYSLKCSLRNRGHEPQPLSGPRYHHFII